MDRRIKFAAIKSLTTAEHDPHRYSAVVINLKLKPAPHRDNLTVLLAVDHIADLTNLPCRYAKGQFAEIRNLSPLNKESPGQPNSDAQVPSPFL